jgi:uncharacterized protein involved in exopolysaccharide biosynthesis
MADLLEETRPPMRDPLVLVLIVGAIAFGCWAIGRAFIWGHDDYTDW